MAIFPDSVAWQGAYAISGIVFLGRTLMIATERSKFYSVVREVSMTALTLAGDVLVRFLDDFVMVSFSSSSILMLSTRWYSSLSRLMLST